MWKIVAHGVVDCQAWNRNSAYSQTHAVADPPSMLLGMYYNGYILFAIFLGHTIGYFAFARDTCTIGSEPGKTESGCAC